MRFDASNDLTRFHSKWLEVWQEPSGWTWGNSSSDFTKEDVSFLLGWSPASEVGQLGEQGGLTVRRNMPLAWIAVLLYFAFIVFGQRIMKDRSPFDLKYPLAAWNLFLGVFSIIGTIRLVPYVLYVAYRKGFTYLMCRSATTTLVNGPAMLWVELFIWSKFPELIDTVFLVLRKKPVNFLHWFHHASVLLYCWYSFAYENPAGVLFAAMNYAVHAVMYVYYFLAAVGRPPLWGKAVTVLQILQMFAGIAITVAQWQLASVENCYVPRSTLDAGFLMYGAYLVLFLQFFVERYMRSVKRD